MGLLDDFDSELDSENATVAVKLIKELGWQFLITSVNREFAENAAQSGAQMFHVEQGRLATM